MIKIQVVNADATKYLNEKWKVMENVMETHEKIEILTESGYKVINNMSSSNLAYYFCELHNQTLESSLINMRDMKPLEVGVVMEDDRFPNYGGNYGGHVVMRTASLRKFEVMDLTKGHEDACWCETNSLKVRLIKNITLNICNE